MFQELITHAKDAIWKIDLEGRICYVNPAAAQLLGYPAGELVGKTYEELLQTDTAWDFPKLLSLIKSQPAPEPFPSVRITQDQQRVQVSSQYAPIYNSDQVLTGISCIDRITNRSFKITSKSEALLETAPDAMVIVDREGHIILVNAQTERLFGYSKSELLDKEVEILIPDTYLRHHKSHRDAYVAHPKVRSMGQGTELLGKKKDGSTFPVEISLSPLETEGEIFVSAAIRDITYRKRAENKFRDLLESAPDAVIIVAEDGVIQLANAQAVNIFGYAKNELIGNRMEMLIPERFRHHHPNHRNSFFHSPKLRPMGAGLELHGLRKNGDEFPVEISLSPLETEEGVLVSAAIRDITDRKESEKAIQSFNLELQTKNQELEQALTDLQRTRDELVENAHKAGMAVIASGALHNVGNILNSVNTSAHLILEQIKNSRIKMLGKANELLAQNLDHIDQFIAKDPNGKKLLDYYLKLSEPLELEHREITTHSQRLLEKIHLINEEIAAQQSYATSGNVNEPLSLPKIVGDALTLFANHIQSQHIQIKSSYEAVSPIAGQNSKLIHVLVNLIKNAEEAMRDLPPDQKIITIRVWEDRKKIYLDFSDTGYGIRPEDIGRMFNQGFTTKSHGHGHGLHSCANYLTEMGGSIQVTSDGYLKGCTFHLVFAKFEPKEMLR